ncbi:MAG TPA: hypothetical protein VFC73_07795 [Syntrophomonadaceae bacterium]|nr:hypothetical protein [Syntrophomonadaceae bacterium]
MGLTGQKNIRILFAFMNIKARSRAVLLNVFEEKNKSDYVSAIRITNDRKDEINSFYFLALDLS